ncbi:hypothetical protein APHAL10511_008549 [Amanita phalloides]|nr:hypothetical protein APHAL10511_008549 [Amanita phalloides]
MKQDNLEMWREAEETAKAVQGSKKDVEGESCEPRKASDSTDFLKAMVDEQRRQTDLLTGMLAEQRQNAEWARQHGQNVEKLLQQLVRKPY